MELSTYDQNIILVYIMIGVFFIATALTIIATKPDSKDKKQSDK